MTADQFDALAQLGGGRGGGRGGPAQESACLVLVHNYAVREAAEMAGVSSNSVTNATARIRKRLALARIAVGVVGA